MRLLDLTGKVFGKWTVIQRVPPDRWLCECSCGTIRSVLRCDLRRGASQSCGCVPHKTKDGRDYTSRELTGTLTHKRWEGMLTRVRHDPLYLGRISVCKRWLSYENFLNDMGECPEGLTLERKNNDGNYEPGNCRWATKAEQTRNNNNNRRITFDGKTQLLSDWAIELGMSVQALHDRLNKWPLDRALTEPLGRATPKHGKDGRFV